MIERFSQGKVSFVNVYNPTADEIHAVMEECRIAPTLMADALSPIPHNYVIAVDGTIKLVIDFPVVKRISSEHPYEVKFFITKNTLVCIEYEEMEAIDRFKKQFEVASVLQKKKKQSTGAHLFVALMHQFYATTALKLDYVDSILSDIESEIFNDNEKQMVVDIARTGKKLIAFRHVLRTHEDMLMNLRPLLGSMLKDVLHDDISELSRTFYLLLNRTNASFETLNALRDTNMAMLTAKQNEIIKTLTIMAFITFPLALFSSMFGMNTVSAPIVGEEGDFWIIVGIMVTVTGFFFSFFKYKRWM